ncbi:hypothetical protein [Kitasatospora sp. CB01950]|uniref:hypothetical protein n=1 Tax=Kitasatospora sp. CB01950 TaxID=1703930 RepID=UPI00093C9964|nr:hypothetical protein [Kitasatospora sp. CB01950]OKJ05674.1 hypothetical protein AMK19_25650 [Kitasatospora sp. CB01950]
MNTRVLRTELRRSAAPWAGLLVLGGSLAILFAIDGIWWRGTAGWTAQWTPMAMWTRWLLAFWWPLSVGAGALYGLRDARSGTAELFGTVPKPAWRRAALPAGAMAGVLMAGFGLVVAAGGVQVALGDTRYRPLGWVPISLVAVLALAAAAVFGMGVARAVPSVLTPPALVVLSLMTVAALLRFTTDGAVPSAPFAPNRFALLSPVTVDPRESLLTLSGSVHLGQTLWLLGLAATGFALLVAATRRARLLALVPVLVGAALALAVLPGDARRTYVVDAAAARPVCDGPVCVTTENRHRLPELSARGAEALHILHEVLGDRAPQAIREDAEPRALGGLRPVDAGTVLVDFDEREFAHASGRDLTRALVAQGLVPTCYARTDREGGMVEDAATQSVAASWALGESALVPVETPGTSMYDRQGWEDARTAWTAFAATPPAEQRARIAALHDAALSCSVDHRATVLAGTEGR